MNNSNTKYAFTSIKDLMQKVLQKNKLEKGVQQIDVTNAWRQVMGEGIWSYTSSVRFNNGTLVVVLKSAVIREEHSYRKEQIMVMMNAFLKSEMVKRVRLM